MGSLNQLLSQLLAAILSETVFEIQKFDRTTKPSKNIKIIKLSLLFVR